MNLADRWATITRDDPIGTTAVSLLVGLFAGLIIGFCLGVWYIA